MKKKVLVMLVSVLLVTACIVGGTLAWLTAQAHEIVNTFTTSDIEINLKETTGDNYKMVPGYTIEKNPKVTVAVGSEECYLFVKLDKSANFDEFLTYAIAEGWTALDGASDVYYRIVEIDAMGTEYDVLKDNQVTVKNEVTKKMMNDLTDDSCPTLTVTAYAFQHHKNADEMFDVDEAWANIFGASGN
jgi:predicted ribosomally synthesized peptide with SipW-like signal peptide